MKDEALLLALETTSPLASLAIMAGENLLRLAATPTHYDLGVRLPDLTESILKETNVTLNDIKAFIVSLGPGSFTSTRIGVTFAKGLAHALELPLFGVNTLEAIATAVADEENSLIVALYPSRPTKPHEVYTASFQCNQCLLTYSEPERAVSLPELVKEISNISGPLKLCGTLSDEQKEMLPVKLAAGFVSQLQSAETIGKIGIQRWGHDCVGDDVYGIKPMYALTSQAEVNFDVRI